MGKTELDLDEETKAILNNPDTMKQLKQSERDIKEGRTKTIARVQDMLDELDEL